MFVRADSNGDGTVDISDPVQSLQALFVDGARVGCISALDANDDGVVDLSDPIYTLAFLFQGGAAPGAPFPICGEDPTDAEPEDCEISQAGC